MTFSAIAQQTTVTGVVVDKHNVGLAFTAISFIKDSITIPTNSNVVGEFKLQDIPNGKYRIRITNLDYRTLDTFLIISNNQVPLNFTLAIDTLRKEYEQNFGYSKEDALADIKNKKMALIIPGGYVSRQIYPRDTLFEKKYEIKYESMGCVQFDVKEYNSTIIKQLDKTYGRTWRKEVRNDVIGLDK